MSTPQMFMDAVAFVDGAADAESIVRVAVNACAGGDAHMTVVGLPRDPRHVLHLAQAPGNVLAKAVNDADVAAKLTDVGIAPWGSTPEQFSVALRGDMELLGALVTKLGIKPQ